VKTKSDGLFDADLLDGNGYFLQLLAVSISVDRQTAPKGLI